MTFATLASVFEAADCPSSSKKEIAETAYDAMAKEANCVFNPDWSACGALKNAVSKTDTAEAEALLEKEKFIYAYSNNKYRSKSFEFFEIKLLVNKENERRVKAARLIKARLEKAGIKVCVQPVVCAKNRADEFFASCHAVPPEALTFISERSGSAQTWILRPSFPPQEKPSSELTFLPLSAVHILT